MTSVQIFHTPTFLCHFWCASGLCSVPPTKTSPILCPPAQDTANTTLLSIMLFLLWNLLISSTLHAKMPSQRRQVTSELLCGGSTHSKWVWSVLAVYSKTKPLCRRHPTLHHLCWHFLRIPSAHGQRWDLYIHQQVQQGDHCSGNMSRLPTSLQL